MENLRNRRKINLVTTKERLKKIAVKPSFKSFTIFHKDLVAVERTITELTLNRPIYVGFSVLDISKILMYDWHYNHVKQHYPDSSRLLFTDTDSLVYSIKTEDLYEDMRKDQHLFDFSGYPKEHSCYSSANKKKNWENEGRTKWYTYGGVCGAKITNVLYKVQMSRP